MFRSLLPCFCASIFSPFLLGNMPSKPLRRLQGYPIYDLATSRCRYVSATKSMNATAEATARRA
jgi:hypothetical protein